ncbi:MAG TPA: CoA ester lyase [Usitatibacter sp.]|nr:CoA ester lyase [Usitatibacter sp.]
MAPDRIPLLQRSLLAVPATNPRFLEKAAQGAADAVFIDLEDAVVPELKEQARTTAIEAIGAIDWGTRALAVRVNDLTTPWGLHDLHELAARAKRLDFVILPKCEAAGDVAAAEAALRGSEIRLAPLIETAKAVAHVETIAAAGERMVAMLFGPGDYGLDLGILDGSADTSFALARIANACRAYNLAPIDGPYFEIANVEGMRQSCKRAAALGFEGKMAIHPSQVEIANEVFAPSAAQLAWAREVLEAMTAAAEQGRGAVKTKDGKMIDLVHIKIARKVLERAERIAKRR